MKLFLILFCVTSVLQLCQGFVFKNYLRENGGNYFNQQWNTNKQNYFQRSEKTTESIGKLTTSLLHDIYLRTGKDFNIVLSPLSVWTVLAMLFEGASGRTEKELSRKLELYYGFPDEGRQIMRSRYKNFRDYLGAKSGPTEFAALNFVISDESKSLNQEYKNIIRGFYDGESFQVNLSEKERFSNMINNWAKSASNNRIQAIVSPGMLENLVMVIGNAVYFKSKWKYPFDPTQTESMPFKGENGKIMRKVPMMNQFLMLPYTESPELRSQILEIPYSDGLTSMIIILPGERVSLISVLTRMKYLSLDKIAPRNMTEETIQLSLPRFHIVNKMFLNEVLRKDLPTVFSRELAEFPNIGKDIYVSKITHKAEIENSEEGTTASAVSSIQFTYKSSGVQFLANRPFIYLINEIKTRTILFAGTYSNPFTA